MENGTVEIEVKGKKVVYYVRSEAWTYGGVTQDIVKELNTSLYDEIICALKTSVEEYKEKLKREEEAKRLAQLKILTEEQNEFKKKIEPLFEKEYTLDFISLERLSYYSKGDTTRFSVTKEGVSASFHWDNKVYRGNSWSASTTDKPYCLDFDCKMTRYATIENAIKSCKKKIEEKINEKKRKQELRMTKEQKDAEMKEAFKKIGLNYERRKEYSNRMEYEKQIVNAAIEVKDQYNYSAISGNVIERETTFLIHNVSIRGKFTTEQFVKLVQVLKEMKIEVA